MASIMFQGTASNVGKSLITAGICRILTQDGYNVVPFKPQNMSLNSFIDEDGGEMGRAQVYQAIASNKVPKSYMNPILLKPCGNHISQLIFCGEVVSNIESRKYQEYKKELIKPLSDLFFRLERDHDVVVIEGAGSPAEININSIDISNMKMAEIANSPVILVADIDRGGVFASVVGTLELLKEDDRKRVKGVIINKFRGKKEYFQEGVSMLEDIIGIPVLGVIPYFSVNLDEEDGVSERFNNTRHNITDDTIIIDVIKYPHMSNHTDLEVFNYIDKVVVRYIDVDSILNRSENMGKIKLDSDILVLPGSKNTIEDLKHLKETPIYNSIVDYYENGGIIVGICGGYQMMGNKLLDCNMEEDGLCFFDKDTRFLDTKRKSQMKFKIGGESWLFKGLEGMEIEGYQLHFGVDYIGGTEVSKPYLASNNIVGTYAHGFFDNIFFTVGIINNIRRKKNLSEIEFPKYSLNQLKMNEYNKIADVLRENLDIKSIYEIIFGQCTE